MYPKQDFMVMNIILVGAILSSSNKEESLANTIATVSPQSHIKRINLPSSPTLLMLLVSNTADPERGVCMPDTVEMHDIPDMWRDLVPGV